MSAHIVFESGRRISPYKVYSRRIFSNKFNTRIPIPQTTVYFVYYLFISLNMWIKIKMTRNTINQRGHKGQKIPLTSALEN